MKKYLFGLGTMLVGAGLMFVWMHVEVEAKDKQESYCEEITPEGRFSYTYSYCKIKDLTCVRTSKKSGVGISCVKN